MSKHTERIYKALRRIEQKSNVAGYVILKDGKHVATVRLSYPRDGAGRLVALVADMTLTRPADVDFTDWTIWQAGSANGGGYDKATAAISGMTIAGLTIQDSGWSWDRQLRDAGMDVIQAV